MDTAEEQSGKTEDKAKEFSNVQSERKRERRYERYQKVHKFQKKWTQAPVNALVTFIKSQDEERAAQLQQDDAIDGTMELWAQFFPWNLMPVDH